MAEIRESTVERIGDDLDVQTRSYSGRGMYGKKCFAVFGGPDTLMKVALNLPHFLANEQETDLDHVEILPAWERVRWDAFGTDTVFYWPDVQIVEDETWDPDADFGGHLNPVDFSRD